MRRLEETNGYIVRLMVPSLLFILCSIFITICDASFHWENLKDPNIWINNFLIQFSFMGFLTIVLDKIHFFKRNPSISLFISYVVSTIITTGINWTLEENLDVRRLYTSIPCSIACGILLYLYTFMKNREHFDKVNIYGTENAKLSSENFQKLSAKDQYDFVQMAKKLGKNKKLEEQMYIYLFAKLNDNITAYKEYEKIMKKERRKKNDISK